MSYQSLEFILFSAAALIVYYAAGPRLQRYALTAANLAFFIIAGAKYLPFILVTTFVSFFCGRWIGKIYENADALIAGGDVVPKEIRAGAKAKAKRALAVALVVDIGLLAVCKYTTFVLSNVNSVLNRLNIAPVTIFNIILPLGISFYTFMAVGYVLDIFWKRYKAETNFILFADFLMYFPHVVQGPIDRYNEFKPQIENGIKLSYQNITFGAQLALWGFFKKLVVADRIGVFVDTVLGSWNEQNGIILILAICVYSIQIYADFSGCIDIVTGISEMFGIKLRKNFNHPYFSKTMAEFWRRWHMSLQEWFKDYVYYPVSISKFVKKNKKRLAAKQMKRLESLFVTCYPILIVWIVTGVWHGAAWKYLAWGLFHASVLIFSEIMRPTFTKLADKIKLDTDSYSWKLQQMLRTFIICCIGRVFFRANGLKAALGIFKKMLTETTLSGITGFTAEMSGLSKPNILVAVVSVIILLTVDVIQENMPVRETLAKQGIIFRWLLIFLALFSVIIFGMYGPGYNASSFIYAQF